MQSWAIAGSGIAIMSPTINRRKCLIETRPCKNLVL